MFREWYPHIPLNIEVLFIDDGDVLTSVAAASAWTCAGT